MLLYEALFNKEWELPHYPIAQLLFLEVYFVGAAFWAASFGRKWTWIAVGTLLTLHLGVFLWLAFGF